MLFHPPISVRQRSKQQGFTLIELLVVIAIIMILAGITFGISRGVQNAQARARVKADLAAISQGLEQFKSKMGDYPWTTNVATDGQINLNAQRLVQALRGDLDWKYDSSDKVDGMTNTTRYGVLRFIEVDRFQTETTASTGDTEVIIDPWGNPYVYDYSREQAGWDNAGYLLYSEGPDGESTAVQITDGGILTPAIRNDDANIDNIYLGE